MIQTEAAKEYFEEQLSAIDKDVVTDIFVCPHGGGRAVAFTASREMVISIKATVK